MSASVKIMLSHDYCHFEVSKSTDENVTDKEINQMRKDVQRLADEAVRQYRVAKEMAIMRSNKQFEIENFEAQCKQIMAKEETNRTIKETAMLKQYQDEKWMKHFEYEYDYEDDNENFK